MKSGTTRRKYDVMFYSPWLGPLLTTDHDVMPAGGAETQIFLIAEGLAARGVRVCVVTFAIEGVAFPTTVHGVDVVARPRFHAKRRIVGKLAEAVAIWRALRAVDASVVITRTAGPHVGVAALLSKVLRRRFIYSTANVSDFDFGILAPNRRDQVLFAWGMRIADDLVVQTDEQANLARKRFHRNPHMIRSVAEPADQRTGAPEAFLWIGRMVWYKRPLDFVELARRIPEARFQLVGVPVPFAPDRTELIRAVESAATDIPNLEVLPPRPRTKLMDLITRAVAVVNTADFEGLPNVLLEGWARGVPALVLRHDPDGIIETYELGVFARGSFERFVTAAQDLWARRDRQLEVSRRCQTYVATHHCADVVVPKWEQALGLASTAAGPSSVLQEAVQR